MRGWSSGQRDAVLRAGEVLAERHRLAVLDVDHDQAVGERDRGLDRLREARAQVRLHAQPVDDDLDRVLELLVELDRLLEQALLAVDLHPREPVAAELLEHVLVLALAVADDRRVDGEARPLRQAQHLVDDLLEALPGDRTAADRAVRPARRARTAGAGSRRSRSRCRRSSAGSARWSSGRSRSPGRGRRSSRRPASPSSGGTGARRRRGSRRSGAGPPRRSCRRRGSTCPSPDRPVMQTSALRGSRTVTSFRLCSRAP